MRDRMIHLLAYAAVLLLFVGGGGWALVTWGPSLACQHLSLLCPPPPGAQELAPYINDYLTAAGPQIDAEDYVRGVGIARPSDLQPYRIGRVAVVDVDERVIDPKLTRALPLDIVATRAGEVGTIVWVLWGETREGTYHRDGVGPETGQAYRGYCGVVVIDAAAGVIVGEKEFRGPSPPATTTGTGDVHTEVDVAGVAGWVSGLPLRDSSPTPPTPTSAPSPSGGGSAALQPGESVTLSGEQNERDVVVPADRFELQAGDYSVVFKGRASNGCTSCMAVKVLNELDQYPIIVVNEPTRIREGRWNFTGAFTLAAWEEGSFHFELAMPKGSWTITLTRDR